MKIEETCTYVVSTHSKYSSTSVDKVKRLVCPQQRPLIRGASEKFYRVRLDCQ